MTNFTDEDTREIAYRLWKTCGGDGFFASAQKHADKLYWAWATGLLAKGIVLPGDPDPWGTLTDSGDVTEKGQ